MADTNIKIDSGFGAIYGLGWIGAAIYLIQQAPGFWPGVLGVLKAAVWPAYVLYHAFKILQIS